MRINKIRGKEQWFIKGQNMNHSKKVRDTSDGRQKKQRKIYRHQSIDRVYDAKYDPQAIKKSVAWFWSSQNNPAPL